ncbi:MAG: hypothetical protein ABSB18_08065, partial [Candidatus Omnitrophota bacterium]
LCSGGYPANCFDDVDKAIEALKKVNSEIKAIRDMDISLLANSWYIWLPVFYNPNKDTDYYDSLNKLIAAVGPVTATGTWQGKIEGKRISLLACKLGCGSPCKTGCATPTCVTNSPCRGPVGALPSSFGTINANLTDEFADVQNRLTDLINKISAFTAACKALYTNIEAVKPPSDSLNIVDTWTDSAGTTQYIDYGGEGRDTPAVYWWCDSAGYHEIRVSVKFTMPSIETCDSSMFKTCTCLEHSAGRPKVTITRLEPKSSMGILGPWNPLLGPSEPARVVPSSGFIKTCSKLVADSCHCDDSVPLFNITRTGTGYYSGGSPSRRVSRIDFTP